MKFLTETTYVSVNEENSSGLIQEGSGSEETNELAFKIMICSGVAVAILLAVFVFCCKSIFLQSKLEFNAEKLINW